MSRRECRASDFGEVAEIRSKRNCSVIQYMSHRECLASDLLPWWENYIHENFSKRIRPAWSHDGANVLVESNKLYYLVVHTALRIRRNRGLPQLVLIPDLNIKHTADILQGILGLAWAFHTNLGRRVLDIKANVVGAAVGMRDSRNLFGVMLLDSTNELACMLLFSSGCELGYR